VQAPAPAVAGIESRGPPRCPAGPRTPRPASAADRF